MIYRIWECIFGNRLTPQLNLLTGESQTAYKPHRSTLGVLSQIENDVKQRKTNQLMLIDLSKAFGGIEIKSSGQFSTKGLPRRYIRALQQGHNGKQLRPKLDGQLGEKINNKGVPQGIPLSAQLFVIYFDSMLPDYDNALPDNIKTHNKKPTKGTCLGDTKPQHNFGGKITQLQKHKPKPQKLYEQNQKLEKAIATYTLMA